MRLDADEAKTKFHGHAGEFAEKRREGEKTTDDTDPSGNILPVATTGVAGAGGKSGDGQMTTDATSHYGDMLAMALQHPRLAGAIPRLDSLKAKDRSEIESYIAEADTPNAAKGRMQKVLERAAQNKRPFVPQSAESQKAEAIAETQRKQQEADEKSAKRAASAKKKADAEMAASVAKKAANAASVPAKTASGLTVKPVETKNGNRFVHTMPATEAYWTLHKSGKKPDFTSVFKDARTGKWELSVWGKDAAEVEANCGKLDDLIHGPAKAKAAAEAAARTAAHEAREAMKSLGHPSVGQGPMYSHHATKFGGMEAFNGLGLAYFPTAAAKVEYEQHVKGLFDAKNIAASAAKAKSLADARDYARSAGRTPAGDVQSLQWNKSLQMKKGDVVKIKSGWGLVLEDSTTEYISRRAEEDAEDRDDFSTRAGHKTYARVLPIEPDAAEQGKAAADAIRAEVRTSMALASDDDRHRDSARYKSAMEADRRLSAGDDPLAVLAEMRKATERMV